MADNLNSATQNRIIELSTQIQALATTYVNKATTLENNVDQVSIYEPSAQAQVDVIVAENTAAYQAYLSAYPSLVSEMNALYASLTPEEQAPVTSYITASQTARDAAVTAKGSFDAMNFTVTSEIRQEVKRKNAEVEESAAKTEEQTDQQNKEFINSGGADGDKEIEAAPGEDQNLLNENPPAGGGAPVIANPTTQAGKAGRNKVKKPDKRWQNPLGNFSSYTYQISLYMITPDAYDAFIQSGRLDINAINNAAPGVSSPESVAAEDANTRDAAVNSGFVQAVGERGRTTSPPSSSSANASTTQFKNGAYLIAQSGGINNNTSKRAPGFDLDFFIDDLKITQAISGQDTLSATNVTDITFTITEPYGFSFITKLRNAATELGKVSKSKNFQDLKNPSRQFFMLGIRFLGYDVNGEVIDPSKIPSADGNPNGNAFGLYERFYDIFITELKFKIDGRAVVYNIKAANIASGTAFGTKRGFVDKGAAVLGSTVYDALMGGMDGQVAAGVKPGEQAASKPPQAGTLGLLAKLNRDQKKLLDTKAIEIASEWDVVFLGESETEIKYASIVNKDVLDKRVWAMSNVSNSSQSNVAAEQESAPDNTVRQITFTKGGSILQCVNQIILQSEYLVNALKTVYVSTAETNEDGKPVEDVQPEEVRIKWYTMTAEVQNLGWDKSQSDFAYRTTFVIQPYETPVIAAPYAKPGKKYYGPHKRYEYWFTGKNSEVLHYEQEMNNAYYNTAVSGGGATSGSSGGNANIPLKVGAEQGQPDQGALDLGLQAQNAYMTSLYDPGAYTTAKIKVLGDPDFLMQPAPSSINSFYDQYYGTDGYTINPNGGQVFIEINFKEPMDYNNRDGLMDINDKIVFWQYPKSVQQDIDSRGGGVSYMVRTVISTFSKGKFEQELTCNINTFPDTPSDAEVAAAAGREAKANQTDAETERLNRSGSGSAPTANGSATTSSVNSINNIQDPAQQAQALEASLPATSVNSLNNVVDPMQRLKQNQTITVPTSTGQVQDDDVGP